MSKQPFDETYSSNAPENYEHFFVPVIGEPLAKELIRQAALQEGERILDVACGTGIVARLARQQAGVAGTVTGVDLNPGMLAVARSATPPDAPIEWHEAGAEAMPLPDEAFDVALCQLGLQFMEDKPGALKEMWRVLAPGGRLLLNIPGPPGPVFTALAGAMEHHIGPAAAGFVNRVFSLHDTEEIRQLLNNAGFRDVTVQAEHTTLSLPEPKAFLWQYVHSTPLAGAVSESDEEVLPALENEVIGTWQDYVDNGALMYQQRIVTACGRKE